MVLHDTGLGGFFDPVCCFSGGIICEFRGVGNRVGLWLIGLFQILCIFIDIFLRVPRLKNMRKIFSAGVAIVPDNRLSC